MIENAALKAQNLLTNEFFTDVVKIQRELYIRNIIDSSPEQGDVREDAYIKIRTLDEFIATLESMAKQPEIEKKRFKIF
jgi:hypothetical protein